MERKLKRQKVIKTIKRAYAKVNGGRSNTGTGDGL